VAQDFLLPFQRFHFRRGVANDVREHVAGLATEIGAYLGENNLEAKKQRARAIYGSVNRANSSFPSASGPYSNRCILRIL